MNEVTSIDSDKPRVTLLSYLNLIQTYMNARKIVRHSVKPSALESI